MLKSIYLRLIQQSFNTKSFFLMLPYTYQLTMFFFDKFSTTRSQLFNPISQDFFQFLK